MAATGRDAGLACRTCAAVLPLPTSRFCPDCGTPVAPVEPESRRTVTLLFTDVTGSTAMGELLDPEAYRGVMARYFEVARDAIEYHGGTVEKFVGDAVLAVFGIPEVREDDAVRAVRAAHDLNARLARLSDELERTHDVRLAIRTGVNTGSVVTGAARAGGSFATGDAVNTAARLEQAAAPGEILIGAETHALVRDAVEVEPADPVLAKGKARPVPAYRLVSVAGDAPGRSRRLEGPLLGRDREALALAQAFERTVEHGRSHLVTVLGAAGLGKSRLVADFVERTGDRATVASGRCVSYGHGITFWPMVQVLRQAVGLVGDESEEVVRRALEAAMDGAPDCTQVADLLLPLLGRGGEPGGADQTSWAVRRVLEQVASRRPLVVTVDDLQWAEPALLALLEQVHDEVADLPLLLVCQARPELLDRHPGWGGGSMNSTTFGLEPLTRDQVASTVVGLLGGRVDDELVRAVHEWSGGNPLFVEEMTSHLVESGLVRADGDRWAVSGDLGRADVPPNVAALLAARLERIPGPERQLLERISVIGLELTTENARALLPGPPDDVASLLAALARRDLLQRVRDAGRETWSFRHLTIRDAAYHSLPKALRAELHERFAASIEAHGAAGTDTPAFIAHHLDQAASYRRELAPHDRRTEDATARAVASLLTAAGHARDRDDREGSLQLVRRAVELGPTDGPRRRELLLLLVQAQDDLGLTAANGHALALLEAATDASASELDRATLRCERLLHRLELSDDLDPVVVEGEARRLEQLAREADDNLRLRRALVILWYACAMSGLWKQVQEAADELAAVGGPSEARRRLHARQAAQLVGPYSLRDLPRLGTTWSALGTPQGEREAAFLEATSAAAAEQPDAPEALARAIELSQLTPGTSSAETAIRVAGICMVGGRRTDAVEWLGRAVLAFRERGDLSHGSTYLALQACLLLELGQETDTVLDLVQEAEEWTSPYDLLTVALVAAARSLLASRAGDHATAAGLADHAVETVDRTEHTLQQADVRRWLAAAAGSRGRSQDERRLLAEALELYRIKEMSHYVDLVERRLAELG